MTHAAPGEDDRAPAGGTVVALSGGIGGAKLALGLSRVLVPGGLTVIANTGDDFEHLGLAISPDLDTLLYTLGGLADPVKGWGRANETWTFMQALQALGGPAWFQLGDGDLATHVERTRRLAAGESLSAITDEFRSRLDIATRLVPMSDDPVRTRVRTTEGWLEFQEYFVRRRCEPAVTAIEFAGVERAGAQPLALAALADPALRAVVICPSNPLISIEPILAVPGMRTALTACRAPVIAVSPIVGGKAVKGPTAKMLSELGSVPDAAGIARRYRGLLDGYVIDTVDAAAANRLDVAVTSAATMMVTLEDREHLARVVLEFADRLSAAGDLAPRMAAVAMNSGSDVVAVVPAKGGDAAKSRLAPTYAAEFRLGLAQAMLEDVLAALSAVTALAGLVVVTIDAAVRAIALRYGATICEDGASDGHTGAVMAAARRLAREGRGGLLTVPADIPLITPDEVTRLIAGHGKAPAFSIVPAHDRRGSNAILMTPPDALALAFGNDSFLPHLATARHVGIEPAIVPLAGIGLDIDNASDLALFMQKPSPTRSWAFLAEQHMVAPYRPEPDGR